MRDAGQEVDAMEDSSLWYILKKNVLGRYYYCTTYYYRLLVRPI
jgi:hypothetical protein